MDYEAPRIEIVEVEIEQGFAVSGTSVGVRDYNNVSLGDYELE